MFFIYQCSILGLLKLEKFKHFRLHGANPEYQLMKLNRWIFDGPSTRLLVTLKKSSEYINVKPFF
jgi:hypothetical protein